jgi:hypothetical protein
MGRAAALLAALLVLPGCSEESTPGGPGAATTTSDGEPANEESTFTLNLPTGATNIEQGMSENVTISVDRGDNFTEAVSLQFQPPAGVTVEPQEATIAAGQDEVEVSIRAEASATPGEQIIEITGMGGSGPPAKGQLQIEVTQADSDSAGAATSPPPSDTPDAATTPPADDPSAVTPPTDDAGATTPPTDDAGAATPPPGATDPAAPPGNPENPEGGAPPENPNP